jgi:hypothetical protein
MRPSHLLLLSALGVSAGGGLVACGSTASDSLLGAGSRGTGGTYGNGDTTGSSSGSTGSSSGGGASSGSTSSNAPPTVSVTDGGAEITFNDGAVETGRELFEALLPQFQITCGNACHELGGSGAPTYLGGTDPYLTITAFTGIVVPTPAASILLTKGVHEGPALSNPLLGQITQWLTVEAAALAAAQSPMTAAMTPATGANTIDLSSLGVPGASLTFTAAVTADILTLSSIEIAAPASTGIQVVFPIFYVNDGSTQTANDGFSNVAQTVAAGTSAPLGPGTLVLTGWAAGDTLQIQMTQYGKATAADAGSSGGCKSVATFTSDAVPQIKANTCLNCHNTGGSGNASLDLSALALATPDYATACAQALTRVNTTTPAQSDIILTPTGAGNAMHPFKTATAAYVSGMEAWIANE